MDELKNPLDARDMDTASADADAPETEQGDRLGTALEFEIGELDPDGERELGADAAFADLTIPTLYGTSETAATSAAHSTVGGGDADKHDGNGNNTGKNETKEELMTAELFKGTAAGGFVEEQMPVKTTYVPRFTELTDKYYNLGKKVHTEEKREETNDATAEEVDATAENDFKPVDNVVVAPVGARLDEPIDESITLYKFERETSEPRIPAASNIHEPQPAWEPPMPEIDIDEQPEQRPRRAGASDIPDPDVTYGRSRSHRPMSDEPSGLYERSAAGEFTAPSQRDAVKDRFLDGLMASRIRLIFSLIMLAGLVCIELFAMRGVRLSDFMGLAPAARIAADAVIDLMFATCLFVLAMPEVVRAVKNLAHGKFVEELFVLIIWLAVAVYDVCIICMSVTQYISLCAVYAFTVSCAIYASYVNTRAGFGNFKVISKNTVKRVLDRRLTRELPRENIAVDGLVDEYTSVTARMFRTAFVSELGSNSKERVNDTRHNMLYAAIALAASVATAVISFFIGGANAAVALQSFILVFMLSVPSSLLLSHSLPFARCVREANADGGAFIGERSLLDCAGVDVLTYEDTDVFGIDDVTIRKVHLYGKAYNTDKAMRQMFALFSAVGGPLDIVFSNAMDGKGDTAVDIRVERDGVSGTLGGKSICAGTLAYMQRHGIAIPEDDHKTNISGNDSTKVMYGAENGSVYVKFFIRYSFSEEFTMIIPYFRSYGIVPLIYTRDPNISCELLRVLTSGDDIIRVMKREELVGATDRTYPRLSATVVTVGSDIDAFDMIVLSKKYQRLRFRQTVAAIVCAAIGTVAAVVFSFLGMFGISASALALWQALGCAYLAIDAKAGFGGRRMSAGKKH